MLNPPIKCHCELETKGTGVEERTLLGDDPKMHKNKGDFAEVNPCLLHPRDFLGMWSPPAHPHPGTRENTLSGQFLLLTERKKKSTT